MKYLIDNINFEFVEKDTEDSEGNEFISVSMYVNGKYVDVEYIPIVSGFVDMMTAKENDRAKITEAEEILMIRNNYGDCACMRLFNK
jgi:hypothetical protein